MKNLITVNFNYEFEVTVNLSKDGPINCTLTKWIVSIIKKFIEICPNPFPTGVYNINIYYRPQGPFACIHCNDHIEYDIGLQVNTAENVKEVIYQLGHELCHFYSDARRSSWFGESCCMMTSYILLHEISKIDFNSNVVEFKKWFSDNKEEIIKNPHEQKNIEKIARVIYPLFAGSLDNLAVLNYLGKAYNPPASRLDECDSNYTVSFDFNLWLRAVPDRYKDFIKQIITMFE
jgi:hypothetical protein